MPLVPQQRLVSAKGASLELAGAELRRILEPYPDCRAVSSSFVTYGMNWEILAVIETV